MTPAITCACLYLSPDCAGCGYKLAQEHSKAKTERLQKELGIADERWERAEEHHKKHEDDFGSCSVEQKNVGCPRKNPDCLRHLTENSGRGSMRMMGGKSVE